MKNLKRSLLAMLLVIVLVASSIVPVSAAGTQPSKYSTTNNSGTRHVVCTTLDGTSAASYYTGSYTYDRLEELSASTLLTTLRGLMTSTHSYKSTYANCRDYANKTDCENGSGTSIKKTMGLWNYEPKDKTTIRCLCPRCLEAYKESGEYVVRRLDPFQKAKDTCDLCHSTGWDYVVTARKFKCSEKSNSST